MAKTIKPEQLAAAIAETLTAYKDATIEDVKTAAKKTAERSEDFIRGKGGYEDHRAKGYRNSFYLKETKGGYTLANKQAGLTFLLEKGHAKRGGAGRTQAFPHWAETEAYAEKLFLEEVKKAVQR